MGGFSTRLATRLALGGSILALASYPMIAAVGRAAGEHPGHDEVSRIPACPDQREPVTDPSE